MPLETIDLTIEVPHATQLESLGQEQTAVKQEADAAAADDDDDEDWEDAGTPRASLADSAVRSFFPCLFPFETELSMSGRICLSSPAMSLFQAVLLIYVCRLADRVQLAMSSSCLSPCRLPTWVAGGSTWAQSQQEHQL